MVQIFNSIYFCIYKTRKNFSAYIQRQINLNIMGLGAPELIMIAVVVLLLFGGKKLPELMRGLGKGINEFKNAKDGDIKDEEQPQAITVPVEKKSL